MSIYTSTHLPKSITRHVRSKNPIYLSDCTQYQEHTHTMTDKPSPDLSLRRQSPAPIRYFNPICRAPGDCQKSRIDGVAQFLPAKEEKPSQCLRLRTSRSKFSTNQLPPETKAKESESMAQHVSGLQCLSMLDLSASRKGGVVLEV